METHDVDESLKQKLKCLVFIPIISRTYCDPKSFAWEHEFKAFVNQASQDQFGLKVKLPNGNVANRVLPIRIHNLDNNDIKLCESALGGFLRGVEFIYGSTGVNRPLTPSDNPEKNLNKTFYRDQINKVALAIKEIILGLKTEPTAYGKDSTQLRESIEEPKRKEEQTEKEKPTNLRKIRLLSIAAIIAILIITTIFTYPNILRHGTVEKLRSSGEKISVAVMPFQNMTNDTTWNIWQKAIQDMLIVDLSNSPDELQIRHTETINSLIQNQGLTNYATMTPSVASFISKKLDANVFIYGSIKRGGTALRVSAQIIDTKTKDVLKTFEIEGPALEEKVFRIADSLKKQVRNFLIISRLNKGISRDIQYSDGTNSPDAYKLFFLGNDAIMKGNFLTGAKMLEGAVAEDSNFVAAKIFLAYRYSTIGRLDDAKRLCNKLYGKRDQVSLTYRIQLDWLHAILFETPNEVIRCLKQYLEIDDQIPTVYYLLGGEYFGLGQIDQGIAQMEKCMDLYKKWKIKPQGYSDYTSLGYGYHKTGQYHKERRLYRKGESDFGDVFYLRRRQAILELSQGNTDAANEYIEKGISIMKENSWPESVILNNLGDIYTEAGILDKAEEYYRQVLSLEPENPIGLNNLAWFLIDKDRDINGGIELIDKALELSPETYYILDTKGWGLYKQGKYQEAKDILQRSWDARVIYDHEVYLHLEAAKKAVANQKNI
ncbi:MAG TPA: tetratricopeptide repeat protein [Bacteroidales bacterium]|nr:tetratricopeptide repeat protein [Bacteroidales bacterium]